MEVRKGYKQTEIGIIPNDWEVTTFENIADKTKKWSITGGPFGSNLKTSDYTNDGVQIIQLQNIGDGSFINESKVYTSKEKANQLLSCNIYPGEIILSKMGDPVARCCFIPNTAERFLMASDGIKLVVNEKKFNKRFVHEYINSKYFRLRAFDISTGSTRLRIGLPNLKSLSFIKPPLQEQTAIANALSDTDGWINSLEQLLTKKRQIKQGAMQELLQPKEGWDKKKLGEIGKPYGGLSGKAKDDFYKGGFPYIPFMNIMTNPIIDTNYVDYVNIKQGEIQNKAQKFDLFFNGSSETPEEVGMCSVLLEDVPNLYLNSFCFGYRLFKEHNINALYLSYFFRSDEGRNLFYSMAQGATRYNLSKGNFLKLEIKLPKPEEQTRIATILSDMDEEIAQLETKLAKAKQIKQGMMQELLTGRIRLV